MHKDKPTFRQVLKGVEQAGSITEYAKAINKPRKTVSNWYNKALAEQEEHLEQQELGVFESKVFIVSSAQISTKVDSDFFENLLKLKETYNAELFISGITYNVNDDFQGGMGDANKKVQACYYDPKVRPYLMNDNIRLNNKIEVLGKLNILPTAVNPLSGYQTFTGERSAIIPHPKIALESVPTRPEKLAKFLMTCGSVTEPNFIQKNAGIKGEFHHQLGAVIIEIVDGKQFHVRHVLADKDGSFYDLCDYYKEGQVTTGHRVDAIIYGDIHHIDLDPVVAEATWGNNGLADMLNPRNQVFHDILDFKVRNHHNRDNPHFMKMMDDHLVQEEVANALEFLNDTVRSDCKSWVVKSNHDEAFTRWVKEVNHFDEPNARNAFFLAACQTLMYSSMVRAKQEGREFKYDALKNYSKSFGMDPSVYFLDQDESCNINEIENVHGDVGLNGSRASAKGFTKIGCKLNAAHSHSATVIEGVYIAGCSRTLKANYTKGPSSWSHSHILQYPNGKRTILTCINGQFFGKRPKGLRQLTLDI